MKKIIALLFVGLSSFLTACSSHLDTSSLPIEVYNHTSKAINFNMTNATEKRLERLGTRLWRRA